MAMDTTIGNLIIGLEVRTEELKAGFERANKILKSYQAKMGGQMGVGRQISAVLGTATRSMLAFGHSLLGIGALIAIPIIGIIRRIFGAVKTVIGFIGKLISNLVGIIFKQLKIVGVAIAGAFVGATFIGAQFEFSMKKVFARLGGESALAVRKVKQLTDIAMELGRTTLFTASEAAGGMEILARAGFGVFQIMKLIPTTLKAAEANAIGLAQTAEIASTIFRAFESKIYSLDQALDMVTYTANNSLNTFEDLGVAYSYIGQVVGPLKTSFAEVSAALGILGNVGLKGSRAGTALRRVLLKLNDLTGPAARFLKELGLSEDAVSTKTYTLAQIVDKLNKAGLDAADTTKLVGIRGGPALSALLSQGGNAIRKFAKEISQTEGYVDRLAEDMQEGLYPQIILLKSAAHGLGITLYNLWKDKLINVVKEITKFVSGLAKSVDESKRLKDIADRLGDSLYEIYNTLKEIGSKLFEGIMVGLGLSVSDIEGMANAANDLLKTLSGGITAGGVAGGVKYVLEISGALARVVSTGVNLVVAAIVVLGIKIGELVRKVEIGIPFLIQGFLPTLLKIGDAVSVMAAKVMIFTIKNKLANLRIADVFSGGLTQDTWNKWDERKRSITNLEAQLSKWTEIQDKGVFRTEDPVAELLQKFKDTTNNITKEERKNQAIANVRFDIATIKFSGAVDKLAGIFDRGFQPVSAEEMGKLAEIGLKEKNKRLAEIAEAKGKRIVENQYRIEAMTAAEYYPFAKKAIPVLIEKLATSRARLKTIKEGTDKFTKLEEEIDSLAYLVREIEFTFITKVKGEREAETAMKHATTKAIKAGQTRQ